MSNTKTSALTALSAQPASNDLIPIVDVSDTTQAASGSLKKITAAYFVQTTGTVVTITGGGTISLGGFTLTVPATGSAALLGTANTFTTTQTITPSATNVSALVLNMPGSTSVDAFQLTYNSASRMRFIQNSTRSQIVFTDFDNTNDIGPHINIGRNNNASTPSAGFLYIMARSATQYAVWPDNSGNLRIGTSLPTSANDSTGTVVGAQTSSLDSKIIHENLPKLADSILGILYAAKYGLRAWSYKSKAYSNEFFPNGLVTDYAQRYGMDRDSDHPCGKSLNTPVAIGDLVAAVGFILNVIGIKNEGDLAQWQV